MYVISAYMITKNNLHLTNKDWSKSDHASVKYLHHSAILHLSTENVSGLKIKGDGSVTEIVYLYVPGAGFFSNGISVL